MSSSPCPTSWLPWPCRTKLWFMACCFELQPRPYWRSPLIPTTSALRSAFWQFSILGVRHSGIIPISIVWSQGVGSPRIIGDGFAADTSSFCPSKFSLWSFRGKFLDALERAFHKHKLTLAGQLTPLQSPPVFAALLRTAAQRDWVVYAKRPFAGPSQVLAYLSRYTHRIAIANSRLLSLANGKITFRWRDYAHGCQSRTMTLEADEFLRRFLLHVLPPGFVLIRYFGILANRQRKLFLNLCREYLQVNYRPPVTTGVANLCQHCHRGMMRVIEVLSPTRLSTWLANAAQPENSS